MAVVLFLALAAGGVVTNMPWTDEAWFASPGHTLITSGYFGTPELDPTAVWNTRVLRGVERRTYWVMPLYLFSQAGWQWIAGSGLFSIRAYSVLWGLLAMAAWYWLIRKLDGDSWTAALMLVLMAIDFEFVWSSSVGRMDMMCAAWGAAGLAAYLWLRERNLARAILVSNCCVVISGLSHPLGLAYLITLIVVALHLDRRRLNWKLVGLAAAPYLAGAAAWGAYIAKDPRMFAEQFGGNMGGRFATGGYLSFLKAQLFDRFIEEYGFGPSTSAAGRVKLIVLVVYLAGFIGAWATPAIRRHAGCRMLLRIWTAMFVTVSLIDREVHYFYMIHLVLPLVGILAVWMVFMWRNRPQWRWAVAGLAGALALTHGAVLAARFRANPYHREYLPAVAFLKAHPANGWIMAAPELIFGLNFPSNLLDDYRLGYLTGKRPGIVVLDRNRYQEWIAALRTKEPAAYSYIQSMLEREFKPAFSNAAYRIYLRSENLAEATPQ